MRILFFMLLLGNVALFAYNWLGSGAQAGSDAQIVGQQLNPDKIRLLLPEQLSTLTRKAEPPKVAAVCLEWGALTAGDSARAEKALEQLALGAKLSQRRQEDIAGFWVYVPPLASRQSAVQKAGEFKRLGVDDYFLVSDDTKWRNAISLGIFKTEEAAKARLAALRTKGVRSAIVGTRETQPGKTFFQVRDATAAVVVKLNELKQGFAGTEVRECALEEKKG